MDPSHARPARAKVVGVYRWKDNARFDHMYYETQHARLTVALLQPLGLLRFEADRTARGAAPQSGDIVAMSNAYFASIDDARQALKEAGAALGADLVNYTDLRPSLHVAEVSVHGAAPA